MAVVLLALDGLLDESAELHCLGGFVVSELYRLTRATADIDVLAVGGMAGLARLKLLAGTGSELHQKYKVYIDIVTIADIPDGYEDRLVDYDVAGLHRIRIRALEKHDLALAKLSRNIDRDIEDIKRLAMGPGLDLNVLQARYEKELQGKLGRPDREGLTLRMWIEMLEELKGSS